MSNEIITIGKKSLGSGQIPLQDGEEPIEGEYTILEDEPEDPPYEPKFSKASTKRGRKGSFGYEEPEGDEAGIRKETRELGKLKKIKEESEILDIKSSTVRSKVKLAEQKEALRKYKPGYKARQEALGLLKSGSEMVQTPRLAKGARSAKATLLPQLSQSERSQYYGSEGMRTYYNPDNSGLKSLTHPSALQTSPLARKALPTGIRQSQAEPKVYGQIRQMALPSPLKYPQVGLAKRASEGSNVANNIYSVLMAHGGAASLSLVTNEMAQTGVTSLEVQSTVASLINKGLVRVVGQGKEKELEVVK